MTNSDTSTAGHSLPARPIFRVFLLATIPPTLIVAMDEMAIAHGIARHWNDSSLVILYVLYVGQVATLTSIVGRFVRSWFLRWTILLWVIALIDLRLFALTLDRWTGCLAFTLLSGQLSLLAFLAILGPGPWPWRLPSVLVAAVVVVYFLFGDETWHEVWSAVLVLQTLVTFPLLALLLLVGFRIRAADPRENSGSPSSKKQGFSFSIRHMLFWMLAAVPVLTIGQHLSPIDPGIFDVITWFRLLFVAACLSVVPVLVVVTVFSKRYTLRLTFLSVLSTTAVGGLLALSVNKNWVAPVALRRTWQDWLLADLTEIGSQWIAWTLLAAAFFAGLLLLFRAAGYRMVRHNTPTKTIDHSGHSPFTIGRV